MCVPVAAVPLIAVGAKFVADAGAAIADHAAQQHTHEKNKSESLRALRETWADIQARQVEEQEAGAQSIMSIDRQARQSDALARVSAGEAGVAGASVDALLGTLEGDQGRARFIAGRNQEMTQGQLEREKRGAASTAVSRINAAPPANPFLTGLRIAGAGVNAGADYFGRLPKIGG